MGDRDGRAAVDMGADAGLVVSTASQRAVRQKQRVRPNAFTERKRQRFLDALALTCNVARSAAHAGVQVTTVYNHRAKDAAFAARWREAFVAGYDRLEALVLEHGGAGVPLDAPDPARAEADGAVQAFDFDRALKVLQLHRAARAGTPPARGRTKARPTPEETNAALLKALAAARRRAERLS